MAFYGFTLAAAFYMGTCIDEDVNDRPIIGVLTQPLNVELLTEDDGVGYRHDDRTFIAASYVKFAESAGARVVPLHFDASDVELTDLFRQINGIIFPGGGTDIKKRPGNRFREAAELLYNLAVNATDKGDPFPIHGTCLGFQLLSVIAAKQDGVICGRCYDTEGSPLPLELTDAAAHSAFFSAAPKHLISAITTQNITENSHVSGVEPKQYEENERLKQFFKVLSTNSDSRGRPFVSTIEAQHYPISGTQWHPEKNNFEWGRIGKLGDKAIPHSADAVLLSQYVANNFVNRARQNSHRFASAAAEQKALIYNHAPVPDPQGYYSQIYLWGNAEQKLQPVGTVVV